MATRRKVPVIDPIRVGNDVYRISFTPSNQTVRIMCSRNEAVIHDHRARINNLTAALSEAKSGLSVDPAVVQAMSSEAKKGNPKKLKMREERRATLNARLGEITANLEKAIAEFNEVNVPSWEKRFPIQEFI